MDQVPAERLELVVPVLPRRGLQQLLRGWSGDGQLFNALAAAFDPELEVQWTPRDIERRAARVLLERMEGALTDLPTSPEAWRKNLPITTASMREVGTRPAHPTDWAATARRFGWPPRSFTSRPRTRVRDETALRTLVWTATELDRITQDARPLAPLLLGRIDPYVQTLIEVARHDLADVEPAQPDRLDLRSLAGSGTPWSWLAVVAANIVHAQTDLEYLAYELIDPDLEWRVFHLSVLGEVLAALVRLGGRVQWRAPLTAAVTTGPQFRITLGPDQWDLWFEAGGASRHYSVGSPYRAATLGVARNQQRSIGADIMLALPRFKSLSIECKWSGNGTYVARDGYHQAASYAIEAKDSVAYDVWSYVVGPSEVVRLRTETELNWSRGKTAIGVCSIEHLSALVASIIAY